MIRFECDYGEGCHPRILQKMQDTNLEQTPGYGGDAYCERARKSIREACGVPDASVEFLVGGTQTNLTVIAAALRPHQGVLAADTGHINCHETGAIEATGHKVLPLPSADGTIWARDVRAACEAHFRDAAFEHTVQPGMVYISHPTENGTLYGKAQLEELSAVCRELGLVLFLDGARLGYGLAAGELTLPDLARLCDVFYIGGTKMGALFGEAVVITLPSLKKDFRYLIKQRGGMMAKGRLLGIQFDVLFEDGLYMEISRRAVAFAMRIRAAFEKKGVSLLYDSPTNQQFPILSLARLEALSKNFVFSYWKRLDKDSAAVRFCTGFATTEEQVSLLEAAIENMPD